VATLTSQKMGGASVSGVTRWGDGEHVRVKKKGKQSALVSAFPQLTMGLSS